MCDRSHIDARQIWEVWIFCLQASLTSFDDTGGKELEIEVVTQEITRLFKLTEGQLQKFGAQHSLSDAEQKASSLSIRAVVQISIVVSLVGTESIMCLKL
jgi:hypothetical protein